jgi:hypothetical protein
MVVIDGSGSGESLRLCVNPLSSVRQCLLWDNHPYSLWNNVLCGTNSLCGQILLNLGYWVISAGNFNLVNRMLINNESSIGAFLHSSLL